MIMNETNEHNANHSINAILNDHDNRLMQEFLSELNKSGFTRIKTTDDLVCAKKPNERIAEIVFPYLLRFDSALLGNILIRFCAVPGSLQCFKVVKQYFLSKKETLKKKNTSLFASDFAQIDEVLALILDNQVKEHYPELIECDYTLLLRTAIRFIQFFGMTNRMKGKIVLSLSGKQMPLWDTIVNITLAQYSKELGLIQYLEPYLKDERKVVRDLSKNAIKYLDKDFVVKQESHYKKTTKENKQVWTEQLERYLYEKEKKDPIMNRLSEKDGAILTDIIRNCQKLGYDEIKVFPDLIVREIRDERIAKMIGSFLFELNDLYVERMLLRHLRIKGNVYCLDTLLSFFRRYIQQLNEQDKDINDDECFEIDWTINGILQKSLDYKFAPMLHDDAAYVCLFHSIVGYIKRNGMSEDFKEKVTMNLNPTVFGTRRTRLSIEYAKSSKDPSFLPILEEYKKSKNAILCKASENAIEYILKKTGASNKKEKNE